MLLVLATAPTAASAASLPVVSATGDAHSCAITKSGAALCWGSDNYGQTDVPVGKSWASISAGILRSCGVTTAGDGYCWGFNGWGQANIPSGKKWNSISAMQAHSCGVTTGGLGYCWGFDISGSNSVPSGKTWDQISAGVSNSCGVTTTGSGFCWGSNSDGQNSLPSGKIWSSISTNDGHSCGVTTSGQGFCWGFRGFRANPPAYTRVPSGKVWASISAGTSHSCGVTVSGEALCWGSADQGELNVPAGNAWASISAGNDRSCGVTTDDRLYCWGSGATNVPDGQFSSSKPSWNPPTVSGTPVGRVNPILNPVSVAFEGVAGTTFECSFDGGSFAACTSPVSNNASTDGEHSIAIRQIDGNHKSDPKRVTWTVDRTAPAKPGLSGGPASSTRSTGATFTISGETSATFTCSLDGADYVACTSPRSLTDLSEGTHTFAVKQTDQAGNTGPAETTTWTVDRTSPTTPGLSGAPGSPTRSTAATFTISGETNATFTCSLDGAGYTSCASPRHLTGLSDGTHTFAVKQTDQAGNTGPAETTTWTVDITPPVAPTLSSGPSGLVYMSSATFGFTGAGAVGFTCALDGQASNPCTSPAAFENLAVGIHAFSVAAIDAAGNVSSATTRRWSVMPNPPTITSAPSGTINPRRTPVKVTFTGVTGAKFQCSMDRGTWTACTSPFAQAGEDGPHTLQVRQVVSRSSVSAFVSLAASADWKIDTVAPSKPSLTGVPAANTTSKNATIAIAAESGASLACRIDGGPAAACELPVALTGLADGVHTLTVTATDSVGNVSASAVAIWKVDTVAPAPPSVAGAPLPITGLTIATLSFGSESGATFRCSVDGGAFTVCNSPKALTRLPSGQHSFSVKAVDSAGNESESTTKWWMVDTAAPPAAILGTKPDTTSASTTASFVITPPDYATVTCALDSTVFKACTTTPSFTGLKAGRHTFTVKVTRGGAVTLTTWTWTIDLSVPAKPIWASAPSGYFGFSGTGATTFECSIDSGALTACVSPLKIPSLPDGDHSIAIRQKSANGKLSASLIGTWTVDIGGHAPTVTGTSVNAFQTLLLGDQRWHVSAHLVFSAGGSSSNSALSLTQVSYSVSKPAATPVPTVVSTVDGVYAWQGLDVQVAPGEVVVGETIPTWIRVGTAGGQWSDWLPVVTD